LFASEQSYKCFQNLNYQHGNRCWFGFAHSHGTFIKLTKQLGSAWTGWIQTYEKNSKNFART